MVDQPTTAALFLCMAGYGAYMAGWGVLRCLLCALRVMRHNIVYLVPSTRKVIQLPLTGWFGQSVA